MWLLREKSGEKKRLTTGHCNRLSKALYIPTAQISHPPDESIGFFANRPFFMRNNGLITWTINGTANRSLGERSRMGIWFTRHNWIPNSNLDNIPLRISLLFTVSHVWNSKLWKIYDERFEKLIENPWNDNGFSWRCWCEIWCHFKIFHSNGFHWSLFGYSDWNR